ncbi:MAG: hypothetical protein ACRDOB_06965, partial [Streptosporangiaceae bacterium]
VRAGPWEPAAPAPPERSRQMPAETPEAATGIRPAVARLAAPAAAEAADAEGPPGGRRGPFIGAAAGGVLVLAAVVAAVALHGHPAQPAPAPLAGSGGSQGGGAVYTGPPGTPVVTAAPEGQDEVRFAWTYTNHQEGDVFGWQRVSGGTGHGTKPEPNLVLTVADGQSVCITVRVVRKDGSFASYWSKPECGS